MLTADQIREELSHQLDAGTLSAAAVARHLKIMPPRVTEMRKRARKVQQALGMRLGGAASVADACRVSSLGR